MEARGTYYDYLHKSILCTYQTHRVRTNLFKDRLISRATQKMISVPGSHLFWGSKQGAGVSRSLVGLGDLEGDFGGEYLTLLGSVLLKVTRSACRFFVWVQANGAIQVQL